MAQLKIKQTRSAIRRSKKQKLTLEALGLRKMHQTVVHNDTLLVIRDSEDQSYLLALDTKTRPLTATDTTWTPARAVGEHRRGAHATAAAAAASRRAAHRYLPRDVWRGRLRSCWGAFEPAAHHRVARRERAHG